MLIETKQVNATPSKTYDGTLNILCQTAAGGAGSTGHIVASDLAAAATPTLTATEIGFGSPTNQLTGDTHLTWDSTNKYLGVNSGSSVNFGIATFKRMLILNNNSNDEHQFTGIGCSSGNMILQVLNTGHGVQILAGTGSVSSSTAHTFNGDGSFVSTGSGQVAGSFKVSGNTNPPYITLGDTSATTGNIIGRTNTASQFFTTAAANSTCIKDSTAGNFIYIGTGTDYQFAIGNNGVFSTKTLNMSAQDITSVNTVSTAQVTFSNSTGAVGSPILGYYEDKTTLTFVMSGPWGATTYNLDVTFVRIGNTVVVSWASIPGAAVSGAATNTILSELSGGVHVPTRFQPAIQQLIPCYLQSGASTSTRVMSEMQVGSGVNDHIYFTLNDGTNFTTNAGLFGGTGIYFV